MNVSRAVASLRHPIRFVPRAPAEPSAALFGRARWRLTLWYMGVLAVILLIAGIVLYLAVQHSLLTPIDQGLQQNAQTAGQNWASSVQQYSVPAGWSPCSSDHLVPPDSLDVCYDTQGRVLGASHLVIKYGPSIESPSLVSSALSTGSAEDTIPVGGFLGGAVERYAMKVTLSGQTLGVVQVAAPVGDRLQALDTLLHLLLVSGVLTLLLAGLGGLFLANRALLPLRLAHNRQRDFIADASHELRTPLTMLRSNVEVVLRGKAGLPAEDVALLEDTVLEAGHLTSIANSMLDLARLDSSGARLEEEIVDLGALATEVVRWAMSLAAEHHLEIRVDAAEPALVVGDRVLLQQALLILIDNAIKYNRPGGEVLVQAALDRRQARLDVRDTGIGIAAAEVRRLGERFYRVDKARSRETGGAGLGLSIVRRIAERHHGSFRLVSEPGRGTTATLSLPAVEAQAPASTT